MYSLSPFPSSSPPTSTSIDRAARPSVDTDSVRTDPVYMNLTLSIDEETLQRARKRAATLGTSVNQLVRDYLRQLAGRSDMDNRMDEFERLSLESDGNSRGWKFNRDEIHERR